jgi:hypothetical protein
MDWDYMYITAKFRVSRKSLLLFSLLVVVLVFSLFVCVFVSGSIGTSLENDVHVKNEDTLRNAIKNVSNGISTTIIMDNDITLTETLRIPVNKDITLTSTVVPKEGF